MGELSTPRIESSVPSSDLDKGFSKDGLPKKRELRGKQSSAPSVESDDPVEEIHQIDELA
jgi:hypothetical protein